MTPRPVDMRRSTSSPLSSRCLLGAKGGVKLPVGSGVCPAGTPKLCLTGLGEKLAGQSCFEIVLAV